LSPGNRRNAEADEPWELELGRGDEIRKAGRGIASDRVDIVRHAEKNLHTGSDSQTYECLRSIDNVGPLLGAPGDTVLKLHALGRDHSGRTGEIRTVGRDRIGAGRTIDSVGAGGVNEKRLTRRTNRGRKATAVSNANASMA
jgi:hypothetical protein